MADGSAQKSLFCIDTGNKNWKLLARRMSFAIGHQEFARCRSTSARNLTSFSQTPGVRYRPFCLRRRDVAGAMKQRTGSDGQPLAAKWRRLRSRDRDTGAAAARGTEPP
jgi:hypothetical protein